MRCRPGACAATARGGRRAFTPAPTRPMQGLTRVRDLMAERSSRAGSAADLLRVGADRSRDGASSAGTGWPKSPRALACPAYAERGPPCDRPPFGREGRAGRSGCIRRSVSSLRHQGSRSGSKQPNPSDQVGDTAIIAIWARVRLGRPPSRPQTMLTVLTQTPRLLIRAGIMAGG
jgi:hypothetical protein